MSKAFFVLAFLVGISAVAGLTVGVTSAAAQAFSADAPESSFRLAAGTTIPTELSKTLDVRKLKRGDSFELRTLVGLVSHDRIVVPERTRIIGHVTDIKSSTKGEPDSKIGITFDSMIFSNDHQVDFRAALQAIGKRLVGNYYIPMPGGGGGVVTQPDQPTLSATTRLNAKGEGAVGLPDLTLDTFVHGGLITSKNSNIRLEAGSQFLLRVTNEQSEAMRGDTVGLQRREAQSAERNSPSS